MKPVCLCILEKLCDQGEGVRDLRDSVPSKCGQGDSEGMEGRLTVPWPFLLLCNTGATSSGTLSSYKIPGYPSALLFPLSAHTLCTEICSLISAWLCLSYSLSHWVKRHCWIDPTDMSTPPDFIYHSSSGHHSAFISMTRKDFNWLPVKGRIIKPCSIKLEETKSHLISCHSKCGLQISNTGIT